MPNDKLSHLEFHPLADAFPLIEGAALDDLVGDIRENGLREPITLLEGLILDGRNRYRACQALGIEPLTRELPGGDPVKFVISLNINRRHMDESQRAMVAAKLANLTDGQRADRRSANLPTLLDGTLAVPPVTQPEAARLLNVSERSVRAAREVQREAVPEVQRAVERGEVSVSAAARVAKLAPDEQREVVAKGPRAIVQKAKTLREQPRSVSVRFTKRTLQIRAVAYPSAERKPLSALRGEEPPRSNLALDDRLKPVLSVGAIEQEQLALDAADDIREGTEIDLDTLEGRAHAINSALSILDPIEITGREYWTVFHKDPSRTVYEGWVRSAHAKLTAILHQSQGGLAPDEAEALRVEVATLRAENEQLQTENNRLRQQQTELEQAPEAVSVKAAGTAGLGRAHAARLCRSKNGAAIRSRTRRP